MDRELSKRVGSFRYSYRASQPAVSNSGFPAYRPARPELVASAAVFVGPRGTRCALKERVD